MKKTNFKIDEIVLVLVVAFIAIIVSVYDNAVKKPVIEAERITMMLLDDHEISFASNGIVDENKVREVQQMPYSQLKKFFNAKKDFCFYIEDENGNIILAKGSSKLNGDGIVCAE